MHEPEDFSPIYITIIAEAAVLIGFLAMVALWSGVGAGAI